MFSSHISDIASTIMDSEFISTDSVADMLSELSAEDTEQVAVCLESEGCDFLATKVRRLGYGNR